MCANRENGAQAKNHRWTQEHLSAYVDNSLPEPEKKRLEAHLSTCDVCSGDLQTLRQTVEWLRRLPEQPIPRSFAIPESERRPSGFGLGQLFPYFSAGAVAAAVLLLLVVSVDLFQGTFSAGQLALAPAMENRSFDQSITVPSGGREEPAAAESLAAAPQSPTVPAVLPLLSATPGYGDEADHRAAEDALQLQRTATRSAPEIERDTDELLAGDEATVPFAAESFAPESVAGVPLQAAPPPAPEQPAGKGDEAATPPSLAASAALPSELPSEMEKASAPLQPGGTAALAEGSAAASDLADSSVTAAPPVPAVPAVTMLQDSGAAHETPTAPAPPAARAARLATVVAEETAPVAVPAQTSAYLQTTTGPTLATPQATESARTRPDSAAPGRPVTWRAIEILLLAILIICGSGMIVARLALRSRER